MYLHEVLYHVIGLEAINMGAPPFRTWFTWIIHIQLASPFSIASCIWLPFEMVFSPLCL